MSVRKIFLILMMFFLNIVYSQNINNRERLAIMNFSIIGNEENVKDFEWLAQGFSESLNDAFSRIPKFSIVERTQLDKIINEQKLQETKKIDSLSVIKVGKILGVEKILIGSCQIYTGHMMVNMRIVNVETGEISPLNNFPVIEPIENVLLIQKKICLEVLKEFNVRIDDEKINEIESTTNSSTKSIKAYEFFTKGITFYENGQYNDALDMFNIALLSDKKYNKAYHKRGLTNYALEKYDNAVLDFENSEKYIKKDSIYVLIGDTYNKKGDNKKAYEFYKKANKINPNNNFIKTKLFEFENKPIIITQNEMISEFETIYEFKNGIARVKSGNKFGFIDINNKTHIPIVFDELEDFKNGLAKAKYNSKWGFINEKGEFVIQPIYTGISDFDERNLARVELKDKWGIINRTGKLILPIEFIITFYYSKWESDDFIVVAKYKNILNLDYNYGVYDLNGKEVLPLIYDDIEIIKLRDEDRNKIDYNYFHVSLDGKWGIVSTQNEIILPFKYKDKNSIKPFKNGYAAVKTNERWGFANEKGIEIIPPTYERVEEIKFNIFLAKEKEKWGVIDITNKVKIPFMYDKIEILANNYLAVKKDSMWSIVNFENQQICEAKYTSMGSEVRNYSYFENDEFKKSILKIPVKIGENFFFINEKCKCISNCK